MSTKRKKTTKKKTTKKTVGVTNKEDKFDASMNSIFDELDNLYGAYIFAGISDFGVAIKETGKSTDILGLIELVRIRITEDIQTKVGEERVNSLLDQIKEAVV